VYPSARKELVMKSGRLKLFCGAVLRTAVFGLWGAFSTVALAQNPVPFINQPLVPDAAAPGGPEFVLAVNGNGFVSGSVVQWNGGAIATQFINGSQLTATVPAANIATARTAASVTVVNPPPDGGTSNVAFFAITSNIGASVAFTLSSLATGTYSYSVAAGDFNGDDNLDLAVADAVSDTVSILLGDGAGNFILASSPAVGSYPVSVAVGDFNGDGELDLAVAIASNPGTVSILLGDGAGNFILGSSSGVGVAPTSVAVGDFNGDGKLDLVVTNGSGVSVLLGDGMGNFTLASSPATGNVPKSVAVGDFNRDGKLDLAVANQDSNTVSILLGDGMGNFAPASSPAVGELPQSLAAGDFNGDGKLDLAVANLNSDTLSILLGDDTGNFALALSPAVGGGSSSVAVGDFNGDGEPDLAVANYFNNTVSILLGDGTGNFSLAASPAVDGGSSSLVVGDFSGDGKLDLAVSTGSTVSMLLTGTIQAVRLTPISLNLGTQLVASASTPQYVTLTNASNASVVITDIAVSGDFVQTNNCGGSIAIGTSCTISVTFTPTTTGIRTGMITVTDNGVNSPRIASLTGTGVVSGFNATLSSSSLTFPSQQAQTTSAPQTVNFTNLGTSILNITSIVVSGDFAATTRCGSSLASGASCIINVTFTPAQTGTRIGTITITDDAPGSPQVVSLTGTGVPPPGVSLLPSSLSFQGCSGAANPAPQTVTLTNNSDSGVVISSISISQVGGSSNFTQANSCGTSLQAGQSCGITVSYSQAPYTNPTYTDIGELDVTTGTPPDTSTLMVALRGIFWFCSSAMSANPSSLAFGFQPVSTTSSPQTITLSGNQPQPAGLSAAVSGDFSATVGPIYGTDRYTWASSVTATFTPTTTGIKAGSVTLNATGSNPLVSYAPLVIPLSGIGGMKGAAGHATVSLINLPLVPDAAAPGGPPFNLTVNGTGFVSGSVVQWNGSALATQLINGSQLKATVPAADIAKAGTANVTVFNPTPDASTSNVAFFTVTYPTSSVAFGPASSVPAGSYPISVVVGDFNGDGDLDLA
jgi:uncharacterized protein (DUF2141 family)